LSQIAETGPISARFQTKRLDKAGLLCPNHTRRLDNLKGVVGEMARIYRSIINAKISSAEGLRLICCLREIRAGLESVNAAEIAASEAEAAAAAKAEAQVEAPPLAINVIGIPLGHYLAADGSFQPMTEEMLKIEPPPQPQFDATSRDVAQDVVPGAAEDDEPLTEADQRELVQRLSDVITMVQQKLGDDVPPAREERDDDDDGGVFSNVRPLRPPARSRRPPWG
jgi:hypothetical protein